MEMRGLGGRDLNDTGRHGARTYLGLTVPGFPNLFPLHGPKTNLGTNSIIHILESQTVYVIDALRNLEHTGAAYLDLRPDVDDALTPRCSAGSPPRSGLPVASAARGSADLHDPPRPCWAIPQLRGLMGHLRWFFDESSPPRVSELGNEVAGCRRTGGPAQHWGTPQQFLAQYR
jgi:hypothetical protein